MSGFSADWLALREPFDAAARSRQLVDVLRTHVPTPLEVVDLGAGAGSNLRFLAPLLGGSQRWRLVDHDAALLAAAERMTTAWSRARGAQVDDAAKPLALATPEFSCAVSCEQLDLSRGLPELTRDTLVTAAALLDLVSASWLDELVAACKNVSSAVHFALTYDGRTTCSPAEPEDGEVLALFNHHQLGAKSFGPALGPAAAREASQRFAAAGFTVRTQPSDWVIGPAHGAMQLALLDGWLAAVLELAPERRAALESWRSRRGAHVAAGRSTLVVGHIDLVGWL